MTPFFRLLFAATFIFFSIISYGQKAETIEHYSTTSFDALIFSENYQHTTFRFNKFFSPTRHDIDNCENEFSTKVKDVSKDKKLQDSLSLILNDFRAYVRQYFGYIDQDGNKMLYIIGIHRDKTSSFSDWGKSLNVLLEVGHYSWYSKYNLTKNKFIDFNLN